MNRFPKDCWGKNCPHFHAVYAEGGHLMDIEKLIERLQNAAGGPEGIKMCQDAATALSTLQDENEKLRKELEWKDMVIELAQRKEREAKAELEQVKRERDAAVECINTVYSYILIKSKTDAVRTIEKWLRGQKED